jgi:hypothetical protein
MLDKFVKLIYLKEQPVKRKEYKTSLKINGKNINSIIIDRHYRIKHKDTVDDGLILELVKKLDNGIFRIEKSNGDFQYFAVEPVYDDRENPYRLVLLLCASDDYIGVINAFRVRKKSYEKA